MVIWNDYADLGTWKLAASVCQFTALEGPGSALGRGWGRRACPDRSRFVRSAGRPCHRPAPEHVRVRVRHGLAALPPGVENDPVAAAVDPLVDSDLMRLADEFVEQTAAGARQCRHVGIVIT